MNNQKVPGTGGDIHVPFEQRTGEQSVVFFTRDMSEEGLKKIYDRVSECMTGKIAVKLHTGEAEGPNIIPRPWVKELLADKLPEAAIVETNTYYEGSRYTTEAHRETLKVNGWTFCDVDIMDEDGVAALPVEGGEAMIRRMESRHGLRQLTYMKELGMGNDRYTLIDLDHSDKEITAVDAVKNVLPTWNPDRYNTFPGKNKLVR